VRPESTLAPDADRWELGSDLEITVESGPAELPWSAHPHGLWGSGRDAIRGLFAWGAREHGWRRLLMPSYFCQDVVASAQRAADVQVYPWSPLETVHAPVATRHGDVVFVDAMYGAPPDVVVDGPAVIIEDHSHDLLAPWALDSRADFVIVSLRKTLPLPDGGAAWSPRGWDVPPEAPMTERHADTCLLRLSAMALKTSYLQGGDVRKDEFRRLAIEGEEKMASGDVTGISPYSRARLGSLPLHRWRERRAANLEAFRASLPDRPGVRLLDVPFAATLVFEDPGLRDLVRSALVSRRIYPAVLWPLDRPVVSGIPDAHRDLSRRILSIPCDQRYAPADMLRVAEELEAVLREHRAA
jgi:hypothetical protein